MKNLTNMMIATVVGLLVIVGGAARFHHHSCDDRLCFCTDGRVDLQCEHHHNDRHGDDECTHSHNEDYDDCALRLDYFKVSDSKSFTADVPATTLFYAICAYGNASDDMHVLIAEYYHFDEYIGDCIDSCPSPLRGPPFIS